MNRSRQHTGSGMIYRNAALKDLAYDVREAVNTLIEMAMYFSGSAKAGKFLIPVGNAYPFLMRCRLSAMAVS